MKFASPFLLLIAFTLAACNTLADRRSLYSPGKASGPYTEAIKTGSWRRGHYQEPKKAAAPTEVAPPPAESQPLP